MSKIRLGGHLPVREGLRHVPVNARAMGYDLVQIMIEKHGPADAVFVNDEVADEYRKMMYSIATYIHLPYTLNPCADVSRHMGWMRSRFRAQMQAACQLGALGVVLHPGHRSDRTEEAALKSFIQFFRETFSPEWTPKILFETDAGSKNGSAVGSLSFIMKGLRALDNPAYGICLDTTHLYARGHDVFKKEVLTEILAVTDRQTGLVHLNAPDLNVKLGSHLDRHNIPFEERDEDSSDLIRTLVSRYPCVLERRSLAIQRQDAEFIRKLMSEDSAVPQTGRTTETD